MHTYNRRVLVILHQCNKWSVLCASSVISPADLRPNPLQHVKAPCAEPEFSSATFLQFSAKVRLCYSIINCLLEIFTLKHLTFPMFYWASHKNKMLAASDRWTRFWTARERWRVVRHRLGLFKIDIFAMVRKWDLNTETFINWLYEQTAECQTLRLTWWSQSTVPGSDKTHIIAVKAGQ